MKDPCRKDNVLPMTEHSPRQTVEGALLERCLNHCSEMLSLAGKFAALLAQGLAEDHADPQRRRPRARGVSLKDAKDDLPTVAAIGLLAMCVVTFDHEALGHGGACFASGGRIVALSSSIFQCDPGSALVAAAGPLSNLVIGAVAMIAYRCAAPRLVALRLFLLLVGVFSWFWEGGYLVQAMLTRNGDAYFAVQGFLGENGGAVRFLGAVLGIAFYAAAIRFAAKSLAQLRPDARGARLIGRVAWFAATAGAVGAALFFRGSGWRDLHDAFFEIGVAGSPLLVLPVRSADGAAAPALKRSGPLIALAAFAFALFACALGRGLGAL